MKCLFYSLSLLFYFLIFCGCTSHINHSDHNDEDHEEEIHNHGEGIEIHKEEALKLGIESEIVNPGEFYNVIKVSGQIEPSETDVMTVTAKRSGIFSLSEGIGSGMEISKGTVIGRISSGGLQGGDVVAAAHANLESAKKELDRLTPLYKEGLVTANEYNSAERTYKEALALSSGNQGGTGVEIAPGDGILSELFVSSGQYVEVGTPIASIVKNSSLTLTADLPERYARLIPSINNATIRPDYSDKTFTLSELGGKKISGISKGTNGFIPVRFTFLSNGEVFPGSFCEVYLSGSRRENILSLPKEALIEMQGNKYAYIVHHDEEYEKRLVKTGQSDGKRVEIISGINPGETVVTKGASVVRMAETSAVAPPQHNHNH